MTTDAEYADWADFEFTEWPTTDAQSRASAIRYDLATLKGKQPTKREINIHLVKWAKWKPCGICQVVQPAPAVDLHHVRGEKNLNVAALMNRQIEELWTEIRKCTVLCVSCHRLHEAGYPAAVIRGWRRAAVLREWREGGPDDIRAEAVRLEREYA